MYQVKLGTTKPSVMKITKLSINQFLALIVLAIFTFNATSCIHTEKLITERENFTLDLPDFSIVTLDFPAKVLIYKGEEQSIKINAQPEIFDAMTKSVIDDEWLIDLANFNGRFESVTIEITMPTVTGLHTTSTGDIIVQDNFDRVELLDLSVQSTGKIQHQGDAQRINLLMNGTGDVELNGQTDFLNARLNSTGDLAAFGLTTQIVDIISTSTGDAEIKVEKELSAVIKSSGDIAYKGNPQISSKITGTGSLKNKN